MKPARHRICPSYCCRAQRRGNHTDPDTHFLRQPLNVALDEVGRGLVSYPGRLRGCVVRAELWIHLCEVSVGVRHGGLDLLLHDFHERVLVGCLRGFEDSLVDHLKDTKKKAVAYVHPYFLTGFYQLSVQRQIPYLTLPQNYQLPVQKNRLEIFGWIPTGN